MSTFFKVFLGIVGGITVTIPFAFVVYLAYSTPEIPVPKPRPLNLPILTVFDTGAKPLEFFEYKTPWNKK